MKKNRVRSSTSDVIPFDQPGAFYYKRAQRYLEMNDVPEAVRLMRLAIEKEPSNAEYMLDLAGLLTDMNRYDQSNEILLLTLQRHEDVLSECYYGLGCNFLGQNELTKAAESLQRYLLLEPEGPYAEEAFRLLDAISAHEKENCDKDVAAKERLGVVDTSRTLMEQGDFEGAIKLLEDIDNGSIDYLFIRNNLALACFLHGDVDRAITIEKDVLHSAPYNVHAMCNLSLFYRKQGQDVLSKEYVQKALACRVEEPLDLNKLAVTLCELGMHEEASKAFDALEQHLPYDRKIMFYHAVSCYNSGNPRKALLLWNRMRKIDPDDSIVDYYSRLAASSVRGDAKIEKLQYIMQVPVSEIVDRIRSINQYLHDHKGPMEDLWKDEGFRSLLLWGLDLGDETVKRAMLQVIFATGQREAEQVLRHYLLKRNEPANIKRDVYAMLKQIGADEPYLAMVDEGIAEVRVNIHKIHVDRFEEPYRAVVEQVLRQMTSRHQGFAAEVIYMWNVFLSAQMPGRIRIRRPQCWAAALEYCYNRHHDKNITLAKLAEMYDTSPSTISIYAERIESTLERMDTHDETD